MIRIRAEAFKAEVADKRRGYWLHFVPPSRSMDVWVRKRVVFVITVHLTPIICALYEDVEDSRLVLHHVGKSFMRLFPLFCSLLEFKLDLRYLSSEIVSSFQWLFCLPCLSHLFLGSFALFSGSRLFLFLFVSKATLFEHVEDVLFRMNRCRRNLFCQNLSEGPELLLGLVF